MRIFFLLTTLYLFIRLFLSRMKIKTKYKGNLRYPLELNKTEFEKKLAEQVAVIMLHNAMKSWRALVISFWFFYISFYYGISTVKQQQFVFVFV